MSVLRVFVSLSDASMMLVACLDNLSVLHTSFSWTSFIMELLVFLD